LTGIQCPVRIQPFQAHCCHDPTHLCLSYLHHFRTHVSPLPNHYHCLNTHARHNPPPFPKRLRKSHHRSDIHVRDNTLPFPKRSKSYYRFDSRSHGNTRPALRRWRLSHGGRYRLNIHARGNILPVLERSHRQLNGCWKSEMPSELKMDLR
jgi:hypothetical protein